MKYLLENQKATIEFGEALGKLAKPGMVFCMQGDLGAGKTTMTKGIAKSLGIKKTVTSPTFTILKIYQGDMPLYHFDAYRLEGIHQDLGFDEYIDGDGLAIIEWSTNIKELIDESLTINISITDDDHRIVELIGDGARYEELIKEFVW